tara:strand:+ start:2226 stop:2960 length:735 start_codon:yes stop_codon:yes gene_type:complete
MSLTISGEGGGGDLPNLEPGIYQGTCYSIVDLGTTDQEYKGVTSKKTRVHLCFEITHALDPESNSVTMDDGRPFAVFKTYTASLFEAAALRKDLESWRGKSFTEEELKGFDISKLLGCTARIEVGHTAPTEFSSGGKPKILALREPREGVTKVDTINDAVLFDLDVYLDDFRGKQSPESKAMCDIFESLPTWQQGDIEKSYEYETVNAAQSPEPGAMAEEVSNLTEEAAKEMNDDSFDEKNIPF